MRVVKETTDEAVLGELGRRLAQVRLGKNLTQAQLAVNAGVSKRTVERLEGGGVAPQLSGFIRICRALDLLERFELLVPEPVASPMAQLKLGGKQRRRASTTASKAMPTRAELNPRVSRMGNGSDGIQGVSRSNLIDFAKFIAVTGSTR